MGTQDEHLDGALSSEVVTIFIDLARIAQLPGSSEPPGGVAHLLLARLLSFCAAQRGALLLSLQGRHTPRILAAHGLSAEGAHAVLEIFPLEDTTTAQIASSELGWLVHRLPLSTLVVQQPGTQFSTQPANPSQVVLLLGWTLIEQNKEVPPFDKGLSMLSFIADAVGAVIVNILLAERIHEMEMTADKVALQEMDLLKAELLATVSHELRSPLASIKGYTATLLRHERRISREERREFLLAIQQGSNRLEFIVDRLLEISQLETGSITIERSFVDVARLVQEALTVAEQRAAARAPGRFTFHLHLKDASGVPTLRPLILADPRRLREVLDNLLENAINYSPEGGAIDVIVRSIQPHLLKGGMPTSPHGESAMSQATAHLPREMLEICVCDHGLGIPDEQLERIFDRFYRVDTGLTREVNGLGLGLSICKRIIELHDGLIWAASCPSGGSAFHIWLPLDAEETSVASTAKNESVILRNQTEGA